MSNCDFGTYPCDCSECRELKEMQNKKFKHEVKTTCEVCKKEFMSYYTNHISREDCCPDCVKKGGTFITKCCSCRNEIDIDIKPHIYPKCEKCIEYDKRMERYRI